LNQRGRTLLADSVAMVSFSFCIGLIIELAFAGMSLEQSLASRGLSVLPNLLTARPYGVYRDALQRKLGLRLPSVKAIDLIAFTTFQVPLYCVILLFAGANTDQIMRAAASISVFSLFMGVPYGLYLDWLRRVLKAV